MSSVTIHTIFEFLSFRRMASPLLLQLLFWAGIAGTLYGVYILYSLEQWAWPIPLVVGPLLIRVIVERAIVSFRVYDRIGNIEHILQEE